MKKLLALAFVALLSCCSVAAGAAEKVVNVFNWSEYIPQEALDLFQKETGIRVVYTTFESNESMYAKLKLLGGKGYDVVVPSVYLVGSLKKAGILGKIDKEAVGGLGNLDSLVLNQKVDPQNDISVPYMWGVTGLVVNKKYVDPSTITGWNDLFRPEFKGKVGLLEDMRDTMGVALRALGYSINTTNESELKAACEWLKKLAPSVRLCAEGAVIKQPLIDEEIIASVAWNGDAFIAMQENPNLVFIYPKDGCPLWMDNFVVPEKSENKANAYAFIKFMLRPEIAAMCVKEYNYTTPNLPARKLLDDERAKNEILFPSAENIGKSEFTFDVGDSLKLYESYWEKFKAGMKQ